MRDPDFARKERRVADVWRKLREDMLRRHPGIDTTNLVLKGQGKSEWRLIVEEVGSEFFVESWMRSRISAKSGLPGAKSGDDNWQLRLDDTYIIVDRDEYGHENHRAKALGDLTKQDMVSINDQKIKNIARAQLAYDDWKWLCDLMFPIFDDHPAWIFRQAFDKLCTDLGDEPIPPSRRR